MSSRTPTRLKGRVVVVVWHVCIAKVPCPTELAQPKDGEAVGSYGHCSLAYYLFSLRRRPMRRQPAIDWLAPRIVLLKLITGPQLPSLTSPRSPADFPQAGVEKIYMCGMWYVHDSVLAMLVVGRDGQYQK